MERPIWKGSLSFGLVNISVGMYTAVRDHRPRFRLLHKSDRSPVRLDRVCIEEGKPVAWQDLVKGYEYDRDKFVVLTRDDFKTAALEKSNSVEILDFVKEVEIDDRFFETPYYLVPQKGAERAYAVLREALRETGKVGIAKLVMRETEHLAAIGVAEDAMVLHTMRFADELADPAQLHLPAAEKLRAPELKMATTLIENLSAKWEPEKYTDDYQANLMRIIEAKMKGKKPSLKEEEPEPRDTQIINLMERLRESLKTERKRPARSKPTAAKRRKSA